jgi:hypothetical protein
MNNLNETDEQLFEVENQYWKNMNSDLESLEKDVRFQRLILQGYFKDKAVDGVSLLARDDIVDNGKRSAVMEDLIAVSSLQDHFIMIKNLGATPSDDEEEME